MSLMAAPANRAQPLQELVVCDADRNLAAAMHVGSIFAPFVVPALVWAVKGRQSKFVGAHARSALVDAIVFNVLLAAMMVASFVYSLIRLWNLYQNDWQGFDWQQFVIRFLVGWIILGLLALVNTAISLRQAYRAYHGRWPQQARANV